MTRHDHRLPLVASHCYPQCGVTIVRSIALVQTHRKMSMLNLKIRFRTLIAVTAVLGFTAVAAADPMFAGLKLLSLDTAVNEKIDVAIWYPTATIAREQNLGPFTMSVALDAPFSSIASTESTAATARPLIMLSHGTGGNSMTHHELASALARSGYIVAALTHPGDNFRDRSMVGTPQYFSERPRQVSRVIDALLANTTWKPRIDAARIGFLGHSAGGLTGLALAGATPSIAAAVRHCAANYDSDSWFCGVSGSKEKTIENAKRAEYIPLVPNSLDARIRAAALLAPVGAFFTETELKKITIPVRVVVAGQDAVLTPRFHAAFVGRSVPNAELITSEAGGHFMLVSKLSIDPVAINGAELNQDPPGFDRAAAIGDAAKALPAWFDKALAK